MKNSANFTGTGDLKELLEKAPSVRVAKSVEELFDLACGKLDSDYLEVLYDLPDGRKIVEATVARVRNGIVANYPEPYMRRRDPDSMLIADDKPTDQQRFHDRMGVEFSSLREETLAWLARQDLALLYFQTGRAGLGEDAAAVVPVNAVFFALGLALMQGILAPDKLPTGFAPRTIFYVAPPFRHTHFKGKQVVVHNRLESVHEIFAYNLYPGPSAKKGVYGSLIRLGAEQGWVTAHCSVVRVVTPYDNEITIMHEGASGGGKSEMLEQPHRLPDGRMLKGRNIVTGEKRYVEIPRTCDLRPVCDDMAMCHPSLQKPGGKLRLIDAEDGWFVRVNHIAEYGADYNLEKLTAQPPRPLLFLNIDAAPGGRAMIWEHIEDAPGVRCPNPRVIIPRAIVPNIIDEAISVDIRSMGVRTPPCTREKPSYGIIGIFHILPPALAWLWRLVAPRGFANPSIVETGEMGSEGVGSYWPFTTGRKVEQANLLLKQIEDTPSTRYILIPNQHIGAWETGFMPQWLTRDYLARRGGAKFRRDQVAAARCPLLGYVPSSMRIEGTRITKWFLEVNSQPEVGEEGYDHGAKIWRDFFHKHVKEFLKPDVAVLGRQIIECCLDNGGVDDYEKFFSRTVI